MVNFIDKSFSYAVVGASNDRSKYGFKVFKDLKDNGFDVTPINPFEDFIDGSRVFSSLTSFYDLTGRTFDVVITVVPPKVTLSIVVEAAGLGIGKLWLQPGSEDEAVIEKCVSLGLDFVSGSCIMLEK